MKKEIIKQFNKICEDIKSLKVQGARNVALAGLKAYYLIPTSSSMKKLLALRPTEPLLANALRLSNKMDYNEFALALERDQETINKIVFRLIKNNNVIFTHCHSSTVVQALIYTKKKGKVFEVYNTETRPLYQGRITSGELKKAGIKVTMFVDSAARIALTKSQDTKKADLMLIGADAILKKGVINKVGSAMFAQIAKDNHIPVYILADTWKFFPKNIEIEERHFEEVWNNPKIKIRNPAFSLVPKKFITGIISELGLLSYKDFLKQVKN